MRLRPALALLACLAPLAGAGPGAAAPAAPAAVRATFAAEVERGLPTWLAPRIAEERTREVGRVGTRQGAVVLWTAPIGRGGFCAAVQQSWLFEGVRTAAGWQERHPVLQAHCAPAAARGRLLYDTAGTPRPDGDAYVVFGRAPRGTERLELRYADGAVERLRLRDGFFLRAVPGRHLLTEARPSLLVALAGARELERRSILSDAEWEDLLADSAPPEPGRPQFHPRIAGFGDAELGVSTSPEGVPCFDFTLGTGGSGLLLVGGCADAVALGTGVDVVFVPLMVHGQARVLVSGAVARHVRRVQLRYADGVVQTLRLYGRVLLAGVPVGHLRPGHRPTGLVAYAADGTVAARRPFRSPVLQRFASELPGR